MRKLITRHFQIRLISIVLPVAVSVLDFILVGTEDMPLALCVNLLSGCAVLMVYPTSSENVRHSLWSGSALASAVLYMHLSSVKIEVILLVQHGWAVFWTFVSGTVRFRHFSAFYKTVSAWRVVEDYSRMFYLAQIGFLSVLALSLKGYPALWVLTSVSCVLFLVLYLRSYFAVTLFIPLEREKKLKRMSHSDLKPEYIPGKDEASRMSSVFRRVMDVMENKQLFLREDISLESLSREVYCNKSSLSRAINVMSGMTFCKFVNSFRIPYAIELMKKDPRLRMKELSQMSGFHNIVTFNMSFKELTGDTPSEYADKIKLGLQ